MVFKLHGTKTPDEQALASAEFSEMYTVIKSEAAEKSRRLSDLWATRSMMHRTCVAIGVQVFCQFTGINGEWSCGFFFFFFGKKVTRLGCSYQLFRTVYV